MLSGMHMLILICILITSSEWFRNWFSKGVKTAAANSGAVSAAAYAIPSRCLRAYRKPHLVRGSSDLSELGGNWALHSSDARTSLAACDVLTWSVSSFHRSVLSQDKVSQNIWADLKVCCCWKRQAPTLICPGLMLLSLLLNGGICLIPSPQRLQGNERCPSTKE